MKHFFVFVAAVAVCGPAFASIHTVSRINDYSLSFDNDRFDNTVFHLSIRQDRTADAPGDSFSQVFTTLPGYYGTSWTGFEGTTVTDTVLTDTSITATIASPDGLPGYSLITYDAPPNGSSIDVGTDTDDRYYLKITLSSGGGVDPGYPSLWRMTIPGDWSSEGTGYRQHELIGYSGAWTLVHDFAYDSLSDTTVFELSTDSYSVPPSPSFALHGIPAPGAAAALALGLGFSPRRRRSR